MDDITIMDFTHLSENLQIHSPYRWTPLIQKQPELTMDNKFQRKMKYFRKLRIFEEDHNKELIDTILFQALKDTGFDYYYDYQAEGKKWHGTIDYLIYNKNSENLLPLIPVVRAKRVLNKDIGKYESNFNIYEAIAAGMWAFNSTKARNSEVQSVKVIMTDGNKWKLIQIGNDGTFDKTGFYQSEVDQFNKIYNDQDMQSIAFGLIRFSLDSLTDKEQALKQVYDFIDERRFMTEVDDRTKEAYNKRLRYYSFLPKSIRELFFKPR